MKTKKIIQYSLLTLLFACSGNVEESSYMVNNTMNEKTDAYAPTSPSSDYKVYTYEEDAVICDKSKKGEYTICDVEGNTISGFVKSLPSNTIAYYENGEQMNGIILMPNNSKMPKTFFKRNGKGDISTIIQYYDDGSIMSKEVSNKNNGITRKKYEKGMKNNKYYDQAQIDTLVEIYNN